MSTATVPPPTTSSAPARPDRAALARAVLARAEERTGASRWVRPLRPVRPVPDEAPAPGAADVDGGPAWPDPSSAAPDDASPAAVEPVELRATARTLPVPDALAGLLPSGALDRGTTVVVEGSTSLTLGLLAEASRTGAWVALVGLPTVGVLAAHQLGLDLDRVVLVPSPGPDAPTVLAALLDGVDVVVVGPAAALGPADRRRLAARARERSAVLVPTTPWPGAHVVLTAEDSRWEGLGQGHGRLLTCRLAVRRSGRGTAARERRLEVTLPLGGAVPPAASDVGAVHGRTTGSDDPGRRATASGVAVLGRAV